MEGAISSFLKQAGGERAAFTFFTVAKYQAGSAGPAGPAASSAPGIRASAVPAKDKVAIDEGDGRRKVQFDTANKSLYESCHAVAEHKTAAAEARENDAVLRAALRDSWDNCRDMVVFTPLLVTGNRLWNTWIPASSLPAEILKIPEVSVISVVMYSCLHGELWAVTNQLLTYDRVPAVDVAEGEEAAEAGADRPQESPGDQEQDSPSPQSPQAPKIQKSQSLSQVPQLAPADSAAPGAQSARGRPAPRGSSVNLAQLQANAVWEAGRHFSSDADGTPSTRHHVYSGLDGEPKLSPPAALKRVARGYPFPANMGKVIGHYLQGNPACECLVFKYVVPCQEPAIFRKDAGPGPLSVSVWSIMPIFRSEDTFWKGCYEREASFSPYKAIQTPGAHAPAPVLAPVPASAAPAEGDDSAARNAEQALARRDEEAAAIPQPSKQFLSVFATAGDRFFVSDGARRDAVEPPGAADYWDRETLSLAAQGRLDKRPLFSPVLAIAAEGQGALARLLYGPLVLRRNLLLCTFSLPAFMQCELVSFLAMLAITRGVARQACLAGVSLPGEAALVSARSLLLAESLSRGPYVSSKLADLRSDKSALRREIRDLERELARLGELRARVAVDGQAALAEAQREQGRLQAELQAAEDDIGAAEREKREEEERAMDRQREAEAEAENARTALREAQESRATRQDALQALQLQRKAYRDELLLAWEAKNEEEAARRRAAEKARQEFEVALMGAEDFAGESMRMLASADPSALERAREERAELEARLAAAQAPIPLDTAPASPARAERVAEKPPERSAEPAAEQVVEAAEVAETPEPVVVRPREEEIEAAAEAARRVVEKTYTQRLRALRVKLQIALEMGVAPDLGEPEL